MEKVCTYKEMWVDQAFCDGDIEYMHEMLDFKLLGDVTSQIEAEEAKPKK